MKKIERSKCIKTILLLLSTLLFPLPLFIVAFYFIPSLYICLVVPYLIWKIWFGKDSRKIKKITLICKLPIIICLAWAMFEIEILLIFLVPFSLSFTWKIIFYIGSLLLLRCITYAMMVLIWQPDILVPYRKLIYAFIPAYCFAAIGFWYSSLDVPDTDDRSTLFYENSAKKVMQKH